MIKHIFCHIDQEALGKNNKRILNFQTFIDVKEDVGDAAAILFQYWFERSFKKNYQFPDDDAARDLKWTMSKVKRLKALLASTGWFHKFRIKNNGMTVYGYFLGKESVAEAKKQIDGPKGLFDKLIPSVTPVA